MHARSQASFETNQSIFACEKHVHVTDDPVMDDDEQSENQERSILQHDVHHNRAHIDRTATRFSRRTVKNQSLIYISRNPLIYSNNIGGL